MLSKKRFVAFFSMLLVPGGFTLGLSLFFLKKLKDKRLLDHILGVLIAVVTIGVVLFRVIIPKQLQALEKCRPGCTLGEPMGIIPLSIAVFLFVTGITLVRVIDWS